MKLLESLKVNVSGIAAFAALTALLIAVTYVLTKTPIANNIKQQASKKLLEIIGEQPIDNDVYNDSINIDGQAFGYSETIQAHFSLRNNKVQTIVFPVKTGQGYSGDIRLLVGINSDSTLAGVRVVDHRETPGLGDKLELKKSPWLLSFNGLQKQANQTWAVKKDGGQFDQFTGATITPRAVVNAVGDALDYFDQHKTQLIQKAARQ